MKQTFPSFQRVVGANRGSPCEDVNRRWGNSKQGPSRPNIIKGSHIQMAATQPKTRRKNRKQQKFLIFPSTRIVL